MTDSIKSLEALFQQACLARSLALIVSGDPAAAEFVQYAEELEAEIDRRAVLD